MRYVNLLCLKVVQNTVIEPNYFVSQMLENMCPLYMVMCAVHVDVCQRSLNGGTPAD